MSRWASSCITRLVPGNANPAPYRPVRRLGDCPPTRAAGRRARIPVGRLMCVPGASPGNRPGVEDKLFDADLAGVARCGSLLFTTIVRQAWPRTASANNSTPVRPRRHQTSRTEKTPLGSSRSRRHQPITIATIATIALVRLVLSSLPDFDRKADGQFREPFRYDEKR